LTVYETFYGLREAPFSIVPDPGFLYMSDQHAMALDLVEYGLINQAGFNIITGAIGTGKTTLVRFIIDQIDRDITVGLISNTHGNFGEMLQWTLLAFGLDYRGKIGVEMFETLAEFLTAEYARGRTALLIIDEAQNLDAEALEQLRMLSNINADKDQLLQVLLVGQAGLRDTLRRPELEQFAQRIAVHCHLDPLTGQETAAYIRHRLARAGAPAREIFNDASCQAVYRYSGGIPRVINLMCDMALVYGYADRSPCINAAIVDAVAADRLKGGLLRPATHLAHAAHPLPDMVSVGQAKKE
jgi:type II secretory pathway predicted ATPase ExeA